MLTLLAAVRVFFRSRSDTALEILALRQQVAVLKRKRPRPCLNSFDRLFWTALQRLWSRWTDVLVIVKPETIGRSASPVRLAPGRLTIRELPGPARLPAGLCANGHFRGTSLPYIDADQNFTHQADKAAMRL